MEEACQSACMWLGHEPVVFILISLCLAQCLGAWVVVAFECIASCCLSYHGIGTGVYHYGFDENGEAVELTRRLPIRPRRLQRDEEPLEFHDARES